MHLLKAMQESGVNKIIFSSSATVYGVKNKNPIIPVSASNWT